MWMKHVYFALSPLKTIWLEELTTQENAFPFYMHCSASALSRSLALSRRRCRFSVCSPQHARFFFLHPKYIQFTCTCTTYIPYRMVLSLRECLIDRGEIEPKRKTLYRFFIHRLLLYSRFMFFFLLSLEFFFSVFVFRIVIKKGRVIFSVSSFWYIICVHVCINRYEDEEYCFSPLR